MITSNITHLAMGANAKQKAEIRSGSIQACLVTYHSGKGVQHCPEKPSNQKSNNVNK